MATFNAHMKTLTFMLTALFISCASLSAYAEEMSTLYNIPERYALLVVTGADPAAPLDTEKFEALLSEEFKKANIEQMQILIYDEGKKPGDGARAFGEMRKDSKIETAPISEIPQSKAEARLLVEKAMGYECAPKKLWQSYEDNEVVADEDFKGKPVIVTFKCQGVSKDALGKAYMKVPVDRSGLLGLHIYVDMKDPNLRKVKKGDIITMQAFPQKFLMRSVMMEGTIVFVEHSKKK